MTVSRNVKKKVTTLEYVGMLVEEYIAYIYIIYSNDICIHYTCIYYTQYRSLKTHPPATGKPKHNVQPGID